MFRILKHRFFPILFISAALSINGLSQELYIGGLTGLSVNKTSESLPRSYFISGFAEFRPLKSLISLNTDPGLFIQNDQLAFSFPLYFKLILSAQTFNPDINYVGLRISPFAGTFIKTNAHYGWMGGLNIEYPLKRRVFVFMKLDYYKDYWKEITPRRNEVIENEQRLLINFGIKKNIYY